MPRYDPSDIYSEESDLTPRDLEQTFKAYFSEAYRLKTEYAGRIDLRIGFECDFIRPQCLDRIRNLQEQFTFDMFIGSVHHVHTTPIDISRELWNQARDASGGSTELLYCAYLEALRELTTSAKPPVLGHFDLIKLMSPDYTQSFREWPEVWKRTKDVLAQAASYGALIEVNVAALRKGWTHPYPGPEIMEHAAEIGLRFCISDDSHSIEQMGVFRREAAEYLERFGVRTLYSLGAEVQPVPYLKALGLDKEAEKKLKEG
jgi:histidinol-phosphatase (PHP family)